MLLNCFKTLKQLGPKRHALDFDETGIGFPYLDIRKPHRFQITLGRESYVKSEDSRCKDYSSV